MRRAQRGRCRASWLDMGVFFMAEIALFGKDLFGDVIKPKTSGPVADRFTIPPFTILDSRMGEWQERKRAWQTMGIKGEIGREKGLLKMSESCEKYMKSHDEYAKEGKPGGTSDYTSIFDPTLCELSIRWFSPAGGQIIDPFAGGSVRGIIAGVLGRKYWGCDLRSEQIEANKIQADEILPEVHPVWVCGDSMEKLSEAPDADMVFSCPPYGDLEKYSDHPSDLSNMEWHTFVGAYKRIILRSVQKMKQDSFACFVVGDFRDNKGFYRNFVSTTIEAFELCGARLYNEAILVTPVGSAAMRVTKMFESARKLAKTHQNVLVFCKGDWRKAAAKCNI